MVEAVDYTRQGSWVACRVAEVPFFVDLETLIAFEVLQQETLVDPYPGTLGGLSVEDLSWLETWVDLLHLAGPLPGSSDVAIDLGLGVVSMA